MSCTEKYKDNDIGVTLEICSMYEVYAHMISHLPPYVTIIRCITVINICVKHTDEGVTISCLLMINHMCINDWLGHLRHVWVKILFLKEKLSRALTAPRAHIDEVPCPANITNFQ